METRIEDDEIGERMGAGRRALMARGLSETGPCQSLLEDGMRHLHTRYRCIMSVLPITGAQPLRRIKPRPRRRAIQSGASRTDCPCLAASFSPRLN
ncbi:protein of unknown function [Ralstonia solanacearum CMR15]|nr:protein of unknown function [Ralstonia solanacearum CMR15]